MPQQQSPWLETAYGWAYGENGWNTGMDSNLLKFSVMFDRNIDSIVASLPPAVNGQVHYNTTDNRIYFAVNTSYFSTPVPKWFTVVVRSTGVTWQYNGTLLVEVQSVGSLDARLDAVEITLSNLGSAAFEDVSAFATQSALDVVEGQSQAYTDILRSELGAVNDPTKGSALIGYRGRSVRERLDDVVNVKDFGAIGNGVADDSAAVAAAIAVGLPVYFPEGTYLITTFGISPATGARLIGAGMGKSELLFRTASTTAISAFVLSNPDTSFEHISVRVEGPVGATVQTFALRASNLTFDYVEIDGGNTALNANVVNAFNFADNDVDNLRVTNCDIHNVQRVNLRTNTNTGTATNLLYMGNRFRAMGQGGLQFNFPLGSISGVRVIGNFFKDFHAGTEQIYTGGASLTNATFANNVFAGVANECIHLEEGGDNISITGNVFAANAHGVFLGDNNVGGGFLAPSRITITGNAFIDGSLTRANEGVRAPNNAVGIETYNGLVIADNVIRGYDRGLNLSAGPQSVHGNTVVNCNIGVRSEKLGPWLTGNTFQNCPTAISGINGAGLVGKNRFYEVTTYASSVDGSRVSMSGFTLDLTADTALPGSVATLIPTGLPLGSANRLWGSLRCVGGISSTAYRHRISEATFDGTTLTDTEKAAVGLGSVALTGFVLDAGTLKARFNNTGTATTLRHFAVEFDGMWTSAA